MALLLIKATNGLNSSILKNSEGCEQRGDCFDVKNDGSKVGKKEYLPGTLIIKIKGKKRDLLHFMSPLEAKGYNVSTGNIETRITSCRRYSFDIDKHFTPERLAMISKSDAFMFDVFTIDDMKDKKNV